ncbi:hypothetical protein PVA45_03130 [Entomospira entomophila]|uniref:SPOR domain-containing protein n=1 Tax=Entomospira entomophila TaxID=2719988 RepID=A0A968G9Q9_9SPIO|nr:hypothetical protein [Entomospira entomophilus]NIZ40507.1 hypothetical protein [Entomospira entomophilus]WDI36066.1 hypothetical protein PVA45_03130 [Entomospira entomophilus]
MQRKIEWLKTKESLAFLLGASLLLGSYTLLIGQSSDSANIEGMHPRFVLARVASFDFFGEPEIEVIIEDADARPPAGSGTEINQAEVIDEYEVTTEPSINQSGDNAHDELFPLPSGDLASEEERSSPEQRVNTNNSRFNEGDRRSTEEKIRGFTRNSEPRPIIEEEDGEDHSRDPYSDDNVDAYQDPFEALDDSELLNPSDSLRQNQRSDPDFVPLIRLVPNQAPDEAIDPSKDSEEFSDNDDSDAYTVVDTPGISLIGEDGSEQIILPSTKDRETSTGDAGDIAPEETIEPEPEPEQIEIIGDSPWPNLPMADQQYLRQFWQSELDDGIYVQVFATLQPLTLRSQIERHRSKLPLIITATYGRLGMMNRLLVGPLKPDELGAVEHQLRLNGVRDYFLVIGTARN